MACAACGAKEFTLIDQCYLACVACGEQQAEIATDVNETDMNKDGKSRFGLLSDAAAPMIDKRGNLILDAAMPFEPPSKTSLGSTRTALDPSYRDTTRRAHIEQRVHGVLRKLVDPLEHSPDVVLQVRRACERMLIQLLENPPEVQWSAEEDSNTILEEEEDEDEESESEVAGGASPPPTKKRRKRKGGLKNRGVRKNAIFAHIVKRVILHFIPEYDDRKYNRNILGPFFRNVSTLQINRHTQKFGVPLFRAAFPEFDANYVRDFQAHQRCKARRLFRKLFEEGQFRSVFHQKEYHYLFEGAGLLIFHPLVDAHLQSWDFATRIGVVVCHLGLTTPDEFVRFMSELDEECVKASTIHMKLQHETVGRLVENAWKHSPDWKALFDAFYADKRVFCVF